MAAGNFKRFPLANQAPAFALGRRLRLPHKAKHLGGAAPLGIDDLSLHRSEGHPVPGGKLFPLIDTTAVDAGAVGAPKINQIDAVRFAMDLGVIT